MALLPARIIATLAVGGADVRFIHITDTHIAPDPSFANYGHEPLRNLEALVDAINALAFPVDFVLHTGDVVQDRSAAAYRLARGALDRLRVPIHYVAGNHDDACLLQEVLLGRDPRCPRFDYQVTAGGVHMTVLDTRGPNDPAGTLTDDQLAALRLLCSPDGPALVIALHHPPLPLDTPWLDEGWREPAGMTATMLLDRGREFVEAIAPARRRLRGVFFGHVHRSFQVLHQGVLYASAPSAFGQLFTWPSSREPEPSPAEPAGFNVVTVMGAATVIRQHALPRPRA